MTEPKNPEDFDIICSFDDLCYPDYYQGHGHAFEPDTLIACLPFAILIDTNLTNQDIEDAIIQEINSQDWPTQLTDFDKTHNLIRKAIQWEQANEPRELQPFNNLDLGTDTYLYGQIHIYKNPDQYQIKYKIL